MKYAIQLKANGVTIDYCDTPGDAQWYLSKEGFELVEIAHSSVVRVTYCELSSPQGYGHSEESFITYGSIRKCLNNLIKWMQDTVKLFGPDAIEITDFFRHCSLTVNGEDKSQWLYSQIYKMDRNTLYI